MPVLSSLARAVGTLTSDGTIPTANDTVTVGGVTYTFKASVTTTANEVDLGANAAEALANLKAAINADPAGSGTLYGSATVENPLVEATTLTSTTLVVQSKVTGAIGNLIPSTETSTHLSWGAATLASGSGNLPAAIENILSYCQLNSEALAAFDEIL